MINQHWTVRQPPGTTSSSVQQVQSSNGLGEQPGTISALVSVVALLVAGAGGSIFLALRDRLNSQVDEQIQKASQDFDNSLATAKAEFDVDRVVNLVNLTNNISQFLWQLIEPQMKKDWMTLCQEGQQAERLRLLTAARDTAFGNYYKMQKDDLVAKAIKLHGTSSEQANRRRTLEIGIMNYGFYEACVVLHEWQQSNPHQFDLDLAAAAVKALDLLEKLHEGQTFDEYATRETRCWILLICTGKGNPDPRIQDAQKDLKLLLDPTISRRGIDAAILNDVKIRYKAAGFDLQHPEPLGP